MRAFKFIKYGIARKKFKKSKKRRLKGERDKETAERSEKLATETFYMYRCYYSRFRASYSRKCGRSERVFRVLNDERVGPSCSLIPKIGIICARAIIIR